MSHPLKLNIDPARVRAKIKAQSHALGFELCGFASIGPFPETAAFGKWLQNGYHGTMEYMARGQEKREDLRKVLPGAKSVIVVAVVYNTDYPYSTQVPRKPGEGWISRYAWGDDYHKIVLKKLKKLRQFIATELDLDLSATKQTLKAYVDTGPILERLYGKYAGLGWIGKNTCLINEQKGSWFFLGELITTLNLVDDNVASPPPDRCGTCHACLDACPTEALIKPYVLDANKCISYLTIEHRGDVRPDLQEKIGDHIFGCDICQDVCPWNRKAEVSDKTDFQPRPNLFKPVLEQFSNLSEEEFKQAFAGSPVKRAKHAGFMRNVANAQR